MNKSSNKGINSIDGYKSFFEDFYPSLHMFANNYLQNEVDSSDVVQEAFIYIWKRRDLICHIPAAKSYLYRYVKNRCLNILRDTKRHQKILNERLDTEIFFRDNLIEQETYELIYKSIKELSAQSQQVIELSLDGLSNKEIAEKLSVSINTIKTVKKRAFKSLRTLLKPDMYTLLCILIGETL